MKSKRATKDTGTRIYGIATTMKANTHEIPIARFARRLANAEQMPSRSVISVPFASSVIHVCHVFVGTNLARVDEAVVCGGELMARQLHQHDGYRCSKGL